MRYPYILVAGTFALAFVSATGAAEPAKSSPPDRATTKASTPRPLHFRDLGGVRGWRAGEKDTIVYVQVQDSSWYKVDLYETCMKFVNDKGLRFITEEETPGERISKVIAGKYICTVLEMTKVDAPPPRQTAK